MGHQYWYEITDSTETCIFCFIHIILDEDSELWISPIDKTSVCWGQYFERYHDDKNGVWNLNHDPGYQSSI